MELELFMKALAQLAHACNELHSLQQMYKSLLVRSQYRGSKLAADAEFESCLQGIATGLNSAAKISVASIGGWFASKLPEKGQGASWSSFSLRRYARDSCTGDFKFGAHR